MKITLRIIVSLVIGTAVIAVVFSYFKTQREEQGLNEDLSLRAELIARSFRSAIDPFLEETVSPNRIDEFLRKFERPERLIGVVVRLKNGSMIALPEALAEDALVQSRSYVAMNERRAAQAEGDWKGKEIHLYAIPLDVQGETVGSLSVVHDRSYIRGRINSSWVYYLTIFALLAFVLSGVSLLVIRWSIIEPMNRISKWTRRIGAGKSNPHAELLEKGGEFGDLLFNVASTVSKLKADRVATIDDESQLSSHVMPEEVYWTKEKLKKYLKSKLGNKQLYVVANREPYLHKKTGGKIECVTPPSGMVTAIDPVLQATGGVWVGHGSGSGDKESSDSRGRVSVPPNNPSYTLKRVWLSDREEKGFYYGFSNEGMWPLCHIAHTRPIFRLKDWETYQKVNKKFADALLEELPDETPYILVQDYHFALVPKYIKEKRPHARVALFWHIPWPNPEVFNICPWKEEILEGMLASDLVSFHTQYHCNNFLDTVDRFLESRIDWNVFGVTRAGATTYVRPFPISINPFVYQETFEAEKGELEKIKKRYHLEDKIVGLGVDRIDYIKGLLERFIALERFLEKYPKYRGKVVFIELGAPSRSTIAGYESHIKAVEKKVENINEKYQEGDYKPIIFLKAHHSAQQIRSFYRMADFCVVNSLHDGMNLVAKEYAAAKEDLNGVLILSQFTGASLEMKTALLINPYDIEETADALNRAISMAPEEKRSRMERMRVAVLERNVYRWAAELITELVKSF